MAEENYYQNEQKNTVATVGMRFSIIGLILFLSAFFVLLWNIILALFWIMGFIICSPLLFIWFILWIIWLFKKPRAKARVAVIIPVIVFIVIKCITYYIWKSIETPTNEFMEWIKPQMEQLENDENFNGERFGDILEIELNTITHSKSGDERKTLFDISTGSNNIEKWAYMLSSIFKEWFEIALEKYNNEELPEIDKKYMDDDDNFIEIEVNTKENDNEEDIEESSNKSSEEDNNKEPTKVEASQKSNRTSNNSEQKDIEEVLSIFE